MRGGIYDKGYIIDSADVKGFVKLRNAAVFKQYEAWLAELPASANYLEQASFEFGRLTGVISSGFPDVVSNF